MEERTWILLVVVLIVGLGPSCWRAFLNRMDYISQVRQFRERYQLSKDLSDRDVMGFCKVVSRLNFEDQTHLDRVLSERDKTADLKEPIWKAFHEEGFGDLWYANPGGQYGRKNFGGRWHAGVFTGPQRDLICVKPCDTNEEANQWLSPEGWTPEQAAQLALEKRAKLAEGRQICHRCGFVGEPWSLAPWHFCGKCSEELSKKSCWGQNASQENGKS